MSENVQPGNYVSTTISLIEWHGNNDESKSAVGQPNIELWTAALRCDPETGALELAIEVPLNHPVYYWRDKDFGPVSIEEILSKIPVHLTAAAVAADEPLLAMGRARAPMPSIIATPGGYISCTYVPRSSIASVTTKEGDGR
jgi:hypothetical protein